MKKLIIAIALTLALFTAFTVCVFAKEGRDVSFENSLASDLKGLGLFSGVSETDFDLERTPSRTEVLVMLIRVLGEEKAALEGNFSHPFDDVPEWANPYVGYAYENGLTKGVSETKFGNDAASSATYLTFMLRALGYSDAEGDFKWDAPQGLAKGLGMLPSIVDTEDFLRADIVTVSYAALPVELKGTTTLLYEKLIEKEVFTAATFGKNYTATKLTDKENKSKTALLAERLYEDCSPAVFYIEIQSKDGTPLASGSGFFIDESGIAVTNYHVVEGAEKAVITLSGSGAKYEVSGIYYTSMEHDVAVIQIDGSGFETLKVNPLPVKGASTVYAIGSPKGLQNTISQGLVSNARRVLGDSTYIQTSAAISGGSSGGVLLNVYGEVIGITSAEIADGQNLNFARPISYIAPAKTDKLTPLENVNWNYVKYSLRQKEYTVKAGEKLTFEFDVTYNTVDGALPNFKASSYDTDVCVAGAGFGDTFVNIAAVAPGSTTVILYDDISDSSVTFTVNVTEGEEKEQPYVEYFCNVSEIGINKGAKKEIKVAALSVGFVGEDQPVRSVYISSENTSVAKLTNLEKYPTNDVVARLFELEDENDYFSVSVLGVKNGTTSFTVKNGKTDDELVIPATVGERFYDAFDGIKDYTVENGEFFDAEDDTKDYYLAEGVQYANGDMTNLVYYPASDKVCLRIVTVSYGVTVDLELTRSGENSGKAVTIDIRYPAADLRIKASIPKISSFGNGVENTVKFEEYQGPEASKKLYMQTIPGLVVVLLYEFDMWFDYILPEFDMSDLGFVSLDYGKYGLS